MLFDRSSLTWKVSILSHVAIVKIVIVHFGSFWENAGKILNNFQSTNRQLFPVESQFHIDFNDGKPVAVIFLERCSEEMLIFNDAFLWLDG